MVADPPRRHHHPRRAGAALGGAAPGERLERRWVERLDRVHTSAAHLVGREEARVDGEAVEMDCASAALTLAAALIHARKTYADTSGKLFEVGGRSLYLILVDMNGGILL